MKKLAKEKRRTITYCESVLYQEERDTEKKSINLIDTFKNYRKHAFRELKDKDDDEIFDEFEDKLLNQIVTLEDELMEQEMQLQASLIDYTNQFFEKVKKLNEDMKNITQAFVQEVSGEMNNFFIELKKYALVEQEKFE